ncbi:hypothetical protein BJV78DRAFT_354644 [Lactifluus subvellereus]|nr:hypothetical protein BJV78DRAFT_354644 [Lactifluus subvellereus]
MGFLPKKISRKKILDGEVLACTTYISGFVNAKGTPDDDSASHGVIRAKFSGHTIPRSSRMQPQPRSQADALVSTVLYSCFYLDTEMPQVAKVGVCGNTTVILSNQASDVMKSPRIMTTAGHLRSPFMIWIRPETTSTTGGPMKSNSKVVSHPL